MLQDPYGSTCDQTVSSYHTTSPSMNMSGKFYKVAGPAPNFWGASNSNWQRRVRQGDPPITYGLAANPYDPPSPPHNHPHNPGSPGSGPPHVPGDVSPRRTGGIPDEPPSLSGHSRGSVCPRTRSV